ncbi:hypothetical protein MNEG_8286, partial [Monoraphidium neglectum]
PAMRTVATVPTVPSEATGVLTGGSNLACACRNANRNPVTGAAISCNCYFVDQSRARSCAGAQFGQASGLWYRSC